MSALEVLVEVIEEIHEAERSLGPGDIPDKIIFKHVKTLWHLLLGIDESKFDSHNYELFDLIFEKNNQSFTGFTYFGLDLESIPQNLVNAIGSPAESTKIIKLLDDESTDDSTETSVSFQLSILNKIRYIVFRHHMMVEELMNESDIVKVIASYMRTDVLKTSDRVSISIKSNNNIFDTCYKEYLENFLLEDVDISINEMAKQVLESFKIEAGVAYFFNLKVITNFHDQIIDLLKRIFRKHELVNVEINDYYTHNPIFPMLKPVYRKIALQNLNQDQNLNRKIIQQENNLQTLKSKLNIKLVIEILKNISEKELKQNLNEIPVTLKLFAEIIKCYCDSLEHDGIKDIENDLYISLIKTVILQWVEKKIETSFFVSQLSDLSLIPTAMPYQYQGTTFPTVHMRMALYAVKENIRLLENYFEFWIDRNFKNIKLNQQHSKWNLYFNRRYWIKWKKKKEHVSKLNVINLHPINYIKIHVYFYKWENTCRNLSLNIKAANIIQQKLYFHKWELQLAKYQNHLMTAIELYHHKLKMQYLTIWISAKITKFPDILGKFIQNKKQIYYYFWKNSTNKIQLDYEHSKNIRNKNLQRSYYLKWQVNSQEPLKRLKKLDKDADKFILKRQFDRWRIQMKLINLEEKLKKIIMIKRMKAQFQKWHRFKKLTDSKNEILGKKSLELTGKYFKIWVSSHSTLIKADTFYSNTKALYILKVWKLKFWEKNFKTKTEISRVEKMVKLWKLNATAKQYHKNKDYFSVQSIFMHWFQKVIGIIEGLENSEAAFLEIKQAIYFDFWKSQSVMNKSLKIKAENFEENYQNHNNLLTKRWSWNTMRFKFREARRKRLELKRIERIYQKRVVNKYFDKFKGKISQNKILVMKADNFKNLIYISRYLGIWTEKYDHILALEDLLFSRLDGDNVNLLTRIISKMQLHMIKIHTDETNADKFKERWNRLKTRTFFELWKFKQSSRNSPTPTARGKITEKSNNIGPIPELNPYMDLEARARGSPEYRPSYNSNMTSLLTNKVSQYDIGGTLTNFVTKSGMETPIFQKRKLKASHYTPLIERKNSKFFNNIVRNSPDKLDKTMTSAERVRKKFLEERVSLYRTLRSPPKTGNYSLEKVEESVQEENRSGFEDSIFNTSAESMVPTSTPIQRNTALG
jgi:hypothetical protein